MQNQPATVLGKVLVVFAFGKGFALVYNATDAMTQFLQDSGAGSDGFDVSYVGIDYDRVSVTKDGVYIAELWFEDDGPGDSPGTRETCVQFATLRLATEDEWKEHLAGCWPWKENYTEENDDGY